tara:strand:+ start:73 stop:702 length:630 start_codon:yes stop_codon:yes gene_type:complete
MIGWEVAAYVIASVFSCLATLGAVYLRHKLSAKKCESIQEETKHNENVYTALNYTLEEMGGDRAYVLEFHNGIHYFSGRGQQKFSCSYEIVQEGISAECHNSQDHRVSNYHTYISELVEKEKFEYIDINEMEDHVFAGLLHQKGVKSIYNVPIKTLNGKIIGILGVDFVKRHAQKNTLGFGAEKKEAHFNEEAFHFMKRQARIIAGYLL